MAVVDARPLRADARRNREAILHAAREVFARDGANAQMDEIARRAKLGVGTLYRHFPHKEALFAALAADHFARITEIARAAAEIEDPWESFETMLVRAAEAMAGDRALAHVLSIAPDAMCNAPREELQVIGARVMKRAQKAGVLRRDARPEDIPLIMCGVSASASAGRFGEGAWRRQLRLTLDGLRTTGPTGRLPSV